MKLKSTNPSSPKGNNRGHRVGDKSWVFGGIEKLLRDGELKRRYPRKNRGKNLSSYLFQQIWLDQNHADVWGAFVKALTEVRYVSGGADGAALEEENDYANEFTSDPEEQEEEQQDEDQENSPPVCEYIGTAPPGGFPFGGRNTTATKKPARMSLTTSPICHVMTDVGTQSSPRRFSSVGSQTVGLKSRAFGTQTSPASTPDAPRGQPIRKRRPPSALKEFEFYNV